jgi:hypothetical protein
MGYEVHVTRAQDWTESDTVPITLDEWLAYVAADPEMRLDNFAEATTTSGETIRYENQGLAVWMTAESKNRGGWLDYRKGRIVAKNPDEEMLAKLKCIAGVLDASVIGDEGELY